MSHLANKLFTNEPRDCRSSTDLKNALDNISKDFVVIPIDKATGNIALVCKRFDATVVTRKLRLNNNSSTDTYNKKQIQNKTYYKKKCRTVLGDNLYLGRKGPKIGFFRLFE